MTTLTVKCPDPLAEQLDEFVKDDWAADHGETVIEALRRFLEPHRPDLARTQVLADVEWGLHGKETSAKGWRGRPRTGRRAQPVSGPVRREDE